MSKGKPQYRGYEYDEVWCPRCTKWFEPNNKEHEAYCEDCGSHLAVECPKCKEIVDLVYAETRIKGEK